MSIIKASKDRRKVGCKPAASLRTEGQTGQDRPLRDPAGRDS